MGGATSPLLMDDELSFRASEGSKVLAYDYPLFAAFWTLAFIAFWLIFLYLAFRVLADIFQSKDIGGPAKALWIALVVFLPFVGILAYVILRVRVRELAASELGRRAANERHQQWDEVESKY